MSSKTIFSFLSLVFPVFDICIFDAFLVSFDPLGGRPLFFFLTDLDVTDTPALDVLGKHVETTNCFRG